MVDSTGTAELELKVAAPAGFQMPRLDGFEELSNAHVVLTAMYWDTDDLLLTGWGHSLRYRSADDGSESGWTLKLAGPPSKLANRREITFEEPAGAPPAAARHALLGVIGRRPLVPVAVVTTERSSRRMKVRAGGSTVEVADDRVTSMVGDTPGPAFREVEVELLDGPRSALRRAAKVLSKAGAGEPDPTPKVARVLVSWPRRAVIPVTTGRPKTVGELVSAAITAGYRQLLERDPLIRVSGQMDDIHKARVATRRLRSDLKSLEPYSDEFRVEGLRRELAWLGAMLGQVRDLDVLADTLAAQVVKLANADHANADHANADTTVVIDDTGADVGADDAAAAEALQQRITKERAQALATLVDVMGGSRYLGLLADLRRLALDPPVRSAKVAKAGATKAMKATTARAFDRVAKRVDDLDDPPATEALHEVRKCVKRARYAAELASSSSRGGTDKLARRLTDLQDTLGATQDAVTATTWLTGISRVGTPAEAFLGGRLSEGFAEDIAAPVAWKRQWRRARDPQLRSWLR
ncbi:MAG: CHAD domain-containing protein [Acidimicrobiales bacterium]